MNHVPLDSLSADATAYLVFCSDDGDEPFHPALLERDHAGTLAATSAASATSTTR